MLEGLEEHPLNEQYPIRMPVYWGYRGESRRSLPMSGISGREVVVVIEKTPSRLERLLMRIFKGPGVLQIPLREKNSILWQLCDGSKTFSEICEIMDSVFNEDISPVIQRTALALEQLKEKRLLILVDNPENIVWSTEPLQVDPRSDHSLFDGLELEAY